MTDHDEKIAAMRASAKTPEQRAQVDAFLDAFAPEDLDPELAAYLAPNRHMGGTGLYHPLVHQPFYSETMHKQYNAQIRYKRDALDTARDEGDWHTYVFLHERPYRHSAFREAAFELEDAEYWDLLHSVWVDTENPWQWGEDVRAFFLGYTEDEDANGEWSGVLGDRDGRHEHFMDDTDKRAFAVLDDEILIYRGWNVRATRLGWSWTTDHLIALWFARRFSNDDVTQQRLTVGKVKKSDVLAYSQGRGESEVIVDPSDVYDVADIELSATCECGLPMPVIERISDEQHMAKHQGAHTNKEFS